MSFILQRKDGRFYIDPEKKLGGLITNELNLRSVVSFLKTLPIDAGTLVDAGAGNLPYRIVYQGRFAECISFDHPASPHLNDAWSFQASLDQIPLEDNTADVVLCTEVLEHVPNPGQCLAELARICRPGGHIILTTPFLKGIHEAPYDFFRYTEFGLRRLCEESGLDVVSLHARGGLIGTLLSIFCGTQFRLWNGLSRMTRIRLHLLYNPLVWLGIYLPQKLYVRLVSDLGENRTRGLARVFKVLARSPMGYVTIARKPEES